MTEQASTDSAATRIGLDDAYAVDGPEDNRKLYASWAETYESVFLAENDYEYHLHVAAAFCGGENLRDGLDGPVLDVGCGTGVVGAELARLGVGVIDGIDISPEMLAKAAAKMHEGRATYRQLFEADLTGRLDRGSDAYAGIVRRGRVHSWPSRPGTDHRVAAGGAIRCALQRGHQLGTRRRGRFRRLAGTAPVGRADQRARLRVATHLRRRGSRRPRPLDTHRRLHRGVSRAARGRCA